MYDSNNYDVTLILTLDSKIENKSKIKLKETWVQCSQVWHLNYNIYTNNTIRDLIL